MVAGKNGSNAKCETVSFDCHYFNFHLLTLYIQNQSNK